MITVSLPLSNLVRKPLETFGLGTLAHFLLAPGVRTWSISYWTLAHIRLFFWVETPSIGRNELFIGKTETWNTAPGRLDGIERDNGRRTSGRRAQARPGYGALGRHQGDGARGQGRGNRDSPPAPLHHLAMDIGVRRPLSDRSALW